jgi:hypothetical protein
LEKLNIELENCYGIKKLKYQIDFSDQKVYAIYAPNGSMKSSLAQTFKDITDGYLSRDRIFSHRDTIRKITDENGLDLHSESVFIIPPSNEDLSHNEKTSVLLVDNNLRKEYEQLFREIDKTKQAFLKAIKEQSGSKKDLEKEISSNFTNNDDEFYSALVRLEDLLLSHKEAPFADIDYDLIFNDRVLEFLEKEDFKTAIENYIKKYNELLDASTFFKKGTFNYYNADQIAKNLSKNGFFDAKHTVNLNADKKLEITSRDQLEEFIAKEKEGISNDEDLRKKYAEIENLITKHAVLRGFNAYLIDHEEILPKLANIEEFKREVLRSYIYEHIELYNDLIEKYHASEERKKEIEEEAGKQKTQWESVIEIFNNRFFVPFKLTAKNKVSVMLGQSPILSLGFIYNDGMDQVLVEKPELMKVLSTGEKKALYILNIIFEIEVRKKAKQETLFLIDDIADSFDYRNKYAIIQYLMDIAEEPHFKQIIMTHNFDFFRTINSRFVSYINCLIAIRDINGISFKQASGIKNIFIKDWKRNFFKDSKKMIASIPFMRNIIEYTKGVQDQDFITLTSLLHWKSNSAKILQMEVDGIFNNLFHSEGESPDSEKVVIQIIREEASKCLHDEDSINLEDKIVLSIAIRIIAEKFLAEKINDSEFVESIRSNQTPKLLTKFKELFPNELDKIGIIQRVILMTPENIHLNAFMYEPIMDMSDEHLKKLFEDVDSLK